MESNMPSFERLYEFLKANYRHERFEGRNSHIWNVDGVEYSSIVTNSHMEYMQEFGIGVIGCFESKIGEVIKFDLDLNIIHDCNGCNGCNCNEVE